MTVLVGGMRVSNANHAPALQVFLPIGSEFYPTILCQFIGYEQ